MWLQIGIIVILAVIAYLFIGWSCPKCKKFKGMKRAGCDRWGDPKYKCKRCGYETVFSDANILK